ncbi:MAG: Sec-independent protein translocase protein TatA [Elusimicrobia bacterium]|nr:Sec-independent protein translocase protein TatA [Elusimicrobiota bacterium]
MPNIGMGELLVILVIILVLFGAKRVPEVARSLGKSIKSFKDGLKEGMEDKSENKDDKK